MSGNATFSGTTYQANVIAYIAVHVLTETKLRWLMVPDDTPTAVSGEVKGPGDDARIEFASTAPIEVQAKHGLKGAGVTKDVVATIRAASASTDSSVVIIAVDSSSSSSVRVDLRSDLDRLRSGRQDGLQQITETILTDLGADIVATLARLRILILDLDVIGDKELIRAQQMLSENLEDPSKAEAAWALLQAEANLICAKRQRRTRKDLVALLRAAGIVMLPPRKTRRWHDDLRHSKTFLAEDAPDLALALLRRVESELAGGSPDNEILYRLHQHKAAAYLQQKKFDMAVRSAKRAIDHDANGIHGLVNLANAYALVGNADEARKTAETVRTVHPDEAVPWVVGAQVAAILGDPIPEPPPHVAALQEYRRGLVQVCIFSGDVARARELSRGLLADGDRSSDLILLRVESLFVDVDDVDVTTRLQRAEEIERLCTDLIESSARPSDAALRRALVGRSQAHRILGRLVEAQADVDRARETSPEDPAVIAAFAQARMQAGDEEGALAQLGSAVVDATPHLLAMRAALQSGRDAKAARKDLDALASLLGNTPKPTNEELDAAAEAALALQDIALARRFLSLASDEHRKAGHHLLLEGRLACTEGDRPRADSLYHRAAEQIPTHKPELLAELASAYLKAGETADAIRIFKELDRLPAGADRLYARALILANDLAGAQALIDKATTNGVLPDWAVGYAATIAHERHDPESVAKYLEALVANDNATADGRLTLVDTLLSLDQQAKAASHLDALIADPTLEPRERMYLAQLLVRAGRPEEGVATALQSYREAPSNPELNRAFAGIVLRSKLAPNEVDTIGPDTHVLLRNDAGETLEFLLFSHLSIHSLPHELSVKNAAAAGLMGLRVGDTFVQHAGSWGQKTWKVAEIQSATKYVFNDVLSNFAARFPHEPMLAAGFKLNPDASAATNLQPLIAAAYEGERHSTKVLTAYREHVPPLDFIAELAGRELPQLMSYLCHSKEKWPLFVEWSDEEGQRVSLAAARVVEPLVLTRSSLFTLQEANLLGTLPNKRTLIAPRSLRDVLRRELRIAEEQLTEGWSSVGTGETGLSIRKLDPGHPALVKERDDCRDLLEWVDKNVSFHPRPLQAFGEGQLDSEMRAHLGDASSDALELAKHTPATLYADDLGLRKVGNAQGVRSVSTVSLLAWFAEAGIITPQERDRLLVDLAERHYNALRASPELLLEALKRPQSDAVTAVFSLLAGPSMDPVKAALTFLRAIKIAVATDIQQVEWTSRIVRLGLGAMGLRFQPRLCALVTARLADDELMLLPTYARIVKKVCADFLKKPWTL